MAFFSIVRYEGDEDKIDSKEKEERILQKLHEVAEKRRRSKQFAEESLEKKRKHDNEISSPTETPHQEKLKKRKHHKEIKNDQPVESVQEKKHRLRKKKDKCERRSISEEKSLKVDEDERLCLTESEQIRDKKHLGEGQESLPSSDSELEDSVSQTISDDGEGISASEAHVPDLLVDDNTELASAEDQNEDRTFTVLGEVHAKKTPTVHRVLPTWLDKPTVITGDLRCKRMPFEAVPDVDARLLDRLRENGITDFFPVQGVMLPELLHSFRFGYRHGDAGFRPSDICCSAPTGSGKTLAYVLPIIQALNDRIVPQVRALVVLPVRDLVKQVYSVFHSYCQGTNVKVVQITGFTTFAREQHLLVKNGPLGSESQCDILVSTPGRLVDHINKTPGFTLKHLRFLVIDEADRMMDEIKQDWLRYVEDAVYSTEGRESQKLDDGCDPVVKDTTDIHGNIKRPPPGPMTASSACKPQLVLQKLLFSATLSQNPEKLQQLNLFQPKLFTAVVHETDDTDTQAEDSKKVKGEFIGKYTTPTGLTELFIESSAAQKPLVLIRFIRHLKFRQIICFTNSVETTHRLYWLIKLTCDVQVREISALQQNAKRLRFIKQFGEGKVHVLVCTDAMARGMDVNNVRYVISYESPAYLKTYIHRAGRTARAGKAGTAITLLEKHEIFRFKQMLKEAGKSQVKEMTVKISQLKPFVPLYRKALTELQQLMQLEEQK